MNKKFSTLMALALLAGSLPVAAENTTAEKWIQVTPTQLVNGAEYRIMKGDSILVDGMNLKSSVVSVAEHGPIFHHKDAAGRYHVWTLTKNGEGFTFKSDSLEAEKAGVVYKYNNAFYTNNTGNQTPTVFKVTTDSYLMVDADTVQSYGGLYVNPSVVEDRKAKVSFLMKQEVPSDIANVVVEEVPALTSIMYVIVGDKYVGLASTETKAIGTGLEGKDTPTDDCLWIYEGGVLKNYTDNSKYLTVNADGDVVASNSPVSVTFANGVLTAEGNNAGVILANTSTPLPYDGPEFTAVSEGTFVVLYGTNGAYSADGEFQAYIPENSEKTVWTLEVKETTQGTNIVRLLNGGKCLEVDQKWVEVVDVDGNTIYNSNDKKIEFPTNGQILLKAGDNYVYINSNGELKTTSQINQANTFGLGQIQVAHISAGELISRYGDHFTLKITYKNEYQKDVDITGVFSGNLRPCIVSYVNGQATYDYDIKGRTNFMLVNEKGNIIAVDKNKPLLAGKGEYGYSFITITPKQYQLDQNDSNAETEYAVWFDMEYTPGQAEGDVSTINNINLGDLRVGLQKDSDGDIVLVAANVSYLLDKDIAIALNAGSVVDATKWLTKPVYYTVKSINKEGYGRNAGKVLGLNEYGSNVAFVDAENIDLTQPEGQFAIKDEGDYFSFTNRETGLVYDEIVAANLYQIDETTFAYVHGNPYYTPDTLSIEPVSNYSSEDGFKRFSPAELNANTYTVSMKLFNGDLLNIIENHTDKHRIGLDEEDATEWRIEMPTVKILDATDDVIRLAADTLKRETKIYFYVDGKLKWTQIENPEKDYYYPNTELQICTYVLKNTDNNEYLDGKDYTESAGNAYYVCNDTKEIATRIAFKKVGSETVRLVPVVSKWLWDVTIDDVTYKTNDWFNSLVQDESDYKNYTGSFYFPGYKIIGGTTAESGILKDEPLYKATSNDLFVVNVAEAPTYKKMEQGDKIILSLKNNTENVLVEGPVGGFATISNREAHKDLNPTLYVDTAYVNRAGNYAYQYLLGVRINRVDTTYKCNEPSHGTHRADTTFGYFLVNMIDSAKACTDVHNNKFEYNGEHKLDFVKGYRTNDTLFFTNDADEVISSMKIGDASYNMAKFAFKMIDEEANEFVIETGDGYDKQVIEKDGKQTTVTNVVTTPSYLRWVNGNLVVTDNIDDAAHFTMEVSDKEATANEAISAGNVVVAGTNGAVVVKGAEGKNVIVSTILGKVVANEVISSDNAQISAPAGIVVVSVDGESFKVVVK